VQLIKAVTGKSEARAGKTPDSGEKSKTMQALQNQGA